MGQLENFRESLQRRDIPTDEENGMRDVVPCRKEMRFRRASIGLSGELHATIKALSFWMKKTGVKENPRMTDVLEVMLEEYFKRYPEARRFTEDIYR